MTVEACRQQQKFEFTASIIDDVCLISLTKATDVNTTFTVDFIDTVDKQKLLNAPAFFV
jgi:hypothetical protein